MTPTTGIWGSRPTWGKEMIHKQIHNQLYVDLKTRGFLGLNLHRIASATALAALAPSFLREALVEVPGAASLRYLAGGRKTWRMSEVSGEYNVHLCIYIYIYILYYIYYIIYIYIYIRATPGLAQALQRRGFPFPNKCWCNFTKMLWEKQHRY